MNRLLIGLSLSIVFAFHLLTSDCFNVELSRNRRLSASHLIIDSTFRSGSFLAASKESQVEDDGYSVHAKSSFLKLLNRINPLNKPEPGTLILVRHGQTTLNYNKTFTGWIDVDLSENGKREVEHAARLLLERGYTVDVTYTSRLKRAIRSSWIILKELGERYMRVGDLLPRLMIIGVTFSILLRNIQLQHF